VVVLPKLLLFSLLVNDIQRSFISHEYSQLLFVGSDCVCSPFS
jgi:hypothetical protein